MQFCTWKVDRAFVALVLQYCFASGFGFTDVSFVSCIWYLTYVIQLFWKLEMAGPVHIRGTRSAWRRETWHCQGIKMLLLGWIESLWTSINYADRCSQTCKVMEEELCWSWKEYLRWALRGSTASVWGGGDSLVCAPGIAGRPSSGFWACLLSKTLCPDFFKNQCLPGTQVPGRILREVQSFNSTGIFYTKPISSTSLGAGATEIRR